MIVQSLPYRGRRLCLDGERARADAACPGRVRDGAGVPHGRARRCSPRSRTRRFSLSTRGHRLLALPMPSVESAGTALFLKRWLRRPLAMGAVVPSGRLLAEAMAKATKAAARRPAAAMSSSWAPAPARSPRRCWPPASRRSVSRWSSATPSWRSSCAGIFPDRASSRATPRACRGCSPTTAFPPSPPSCRACRCCRCRPTS